MLAKVGDPRPRIAAQLDAFTKLQTSSPDASRFTSGGGNRYDYWRIAIDQFQAAPLVGVGAGNYDRTYFLERRTSEDIRQPHSIELQTLAELGLVGGLALALFLGGVLVGFGRRALAARHDPMAAAMAVGGGGTFFTWLTHTSVDWLHNIPGLTGVALCGAAVLLGPWARPRAHIARSRGRIFVTAGCALLVAFAAIHLGRSTLADHNRAQSLAALDSDPRRALAEADESLALNGDALSAHYARASAFARLDDYDRARGALLEARLREPHDFVTWGLLGDLAVRRGDYEQARREYGRALALNPRDPALAQLARDPLAGRAP